VCGTVWCGFGGVSVQQVALWCLYIGIVCVLCVGQFVVVWGVSVQQVALWCLYIGIVCVCAVCGTVWYEFGGVSVQQVALRCLYIGIVCVLCVGQFGVCLGE